MEQLKFEELDEAKIYQGDGPALLDIVLDTLREHVPEPYNELLSDPAILLKVLRGSVTSELKQIRGFHLETYQDHAVGLLHQ